MKKQLINLRMVVFASLLLLIGKSAFGQTLIQPVQNSSPGEKCTAHIIHNQMMQTDPAYAQRMQEYENYVLSQSSSITPKAAATYRIPVVVHVLHKGEPIGTGTNVSDADIQKAIKNMNERYRKTKAGLGGVDMQIEFALAVRDPNGNCTNGITRVSMTGNSNYMANGVRPGASGVGITDAALKAVTSWDRTKYYNIYLVSEFDNNNGGSGVQGYAYLASSHGQPEDGAAILASNFTNEFTMTTTHELGHALNLLHTFEGDGIGNDCPSSNPTQGDKCADTPPHKRSASDCNTAGTNSCDGGSSNNLFIHNYMDYSSDDCVNMFTANQRTRALAACSGPRASFFVAGNLALVPVAVPTAEFSATKSIICSGQSVQFFDESSCVPNTYLAETNFPNLTFAWTFSNGVVTLNSSLQNPVMNFTSPGAYDVTLTVTNSLGTSTLTKSAFVVLGGTTATACTPNIGQSGNYAQTISNVKFNTINSSTNPYVNSYQNLTCSYSTIVNSGASYALSITGSAAGAAEKFEVYIDYNNNGEFSPGELIYSGSIPNGPSQSFNSQTFTTNITIPASAVKNTTLRMRVMGNYGNITAGNRNCTSNFTAGDVEDYGIYIINPCTVAPTISTQPAAASVCMGVNTNFSVIASTATTYQWQVSTNSGSTWSNINNGGVYSNASSATLTITGATMAMDSYKYRCITSNTCGTTNSASQTLTVKPSPTISSTTPASRCGTGTVVLNAAGSAGTLSWYNTPAGGSAIGTGTSFTTPSISTSQNFFVSSTNAGCSSARSAVMATVNKDVTMTSNPSNTTICNGQSITLTAANGSAYSWSSGQTSATITVSPSQTTTYTVTGTSPCVNTASITVTVDPCLGVNENDQDDLLVLYPNPTSGSLTIEGVNLVNYQNIELRDVTGRLILTENVNGSKMNIDLSPIANGNYIIHVLGAEKTITRKIQVVK